MYASRSNPRAFTMLAAALLMGTAFAGCVTQDAQASSGALYVKDALTDEAAEVHVTFTKAEMLPADASEWAPVYEGEQTIELLSLSGSADKAQLANFTIEPGEYQRLRLTIQNVTVVHHDGTSEELVVYGNVVTVGEDLTFTPDGELEAVLDFDLETGVNLTSGEYVPVVADVQRSDEDADQDGQPDFVDTDDDGDGIEDAEDDDRDGDGQPDLPEQSQAFDRQGLFGLCTAWENNQEGRENGTAGNASAFQWLAEQAEADGQSIEAYCEDQTRPGAPDDLAEVLPEDLPEQARNAVEDRHLGPPEDRSGDARGDEADDRSDADRERGEAAANESQEDRQPDNRTDGEDGDPQQDANNTDGNQSDEEDRRGDDGSGDGRP